MTSPEKVNVTLYKTASICLLNAITAHTSRDKLLETYQPVEGEVEVELRVNGHVVPFTPTIEHMWSQLIKDRDAEARRQAIEMIAALGFDDVRKTLDQFQQSLRTELKAKYPVFDPEENEDE